MPIKLSAGICGINFLRYLGLTQFLGWLKPKTQQTGALGSKLYFRFKGHQIFKTVLKYSGYPLIY